jgi:WD40 repeat protein
MSPDATRLGVLYFPSNQIEWIDLKHRQLLWQASAPEFANSLDLSPDGARLAVGGKALFLFSVDDPTRVAIFSKFDNNIHQVRFSPAGDALAASSYDGHLRIVSATTEGGALALRKDLRHAGTANVYAFRFTRDGRRLYSCSGDRTVRLFGL